MKRFVILGTIVLAVVIGWTAAWFWAAGEIRKTALALADADGITTPKLTCGTIDVRGFPFRFDLVCDQAAIISGDLYVTVSGLEATVLVYQPTQALATAKGPLTLTDAFTGSKSRVDWTSMVMSARLGGWRIDRISLVADNLAWTDTVVGETLIAKATHAEAHLLDMPDQHNAETRLTALAGYATAKEVQAPGLDIKDGDASFEADLSQVPDDVRNFADPALVQRWIANGGALHVYGLKGTDGETTFDGSGTFSLDEAALIQGDMNIASRGVVERIEPLLQPGWGTLVFGNPTADGSYAQTLTIKGGVIYSGLIPIAAIPPLL